MIGGSQSISEAARRRRSAPLKFGRFAFCPPSRESGGLLNVDRESALQRDRRRDGPSARIRSAVLLFVRPLLAGWPNGSWIIGASKHAMRHVEHAGAVLRQRVVAGRCELLACRAAPACDGMKL